MWFVCRIFPQILWIEFRIGNIKVGKMGCHSGQPIAQPHKTFCVYVKRESENIWAHSIENTLTLLSADSNGRVMMAASVFD